MRELQPHAKIPTKQRRHHELRHRWKWCVSVSPRCADTRRLPSIAQMKQTSLGLRSLTNAVCVSANQVDTRPAENMGLARLEIAERNQIVTIILPAMLGYGNAKQKGRVNMGDKSPKSTKKQAAQKQTKANAAGQKKADDIAVKKAANTKK